MSMIVDGMDQSKTSIPHWPVDSKTTSTCEKLKTHVVGVRIHGIGNNGFMDFNQFPHDTNLTIMAIMQSMMMLESLPPVLYVQLDNTSRENKNRLGKLNYEIIAYYHVKISNSW